MFSGTAFILFHTAISLVAILAGIGVMAMLLGNRSPNAGTAIFLIMALATSITGFLFPFMGATPAFLTGLIALALLVLALVAQFAFRLAGAWSRIYAFAMSVNVYLLMFVLVTQMFLKIPALHALDPGAPAAPGPVFAGVQGVLLLAFVWLTWKAVRAYRRGPAIPPAGAAAA